MVKETALDHASTLRFTFLIFFCKIIANHKHGCYGRRGGFDTGRKNFTLNGQSKRLPCVQSVFQKATGLNWLSIEKRQLGLEN